MKIRWKKNITKNKMVAFKKLSTKTDITKVKEPK